MPEDNNATPLNLKKKKTAKGLLVGGFILSIIYQIITVLAFIASFVIIVLLQVIVMVLASVFAAIFSGGNSSSASSAASSVDLLKDYWWVMVIAGLLMVFAFFAMIFALVALILFNTAKTKKKGIVAGVFGILSGLGMLFIPIELIGGIMSFFITDEQYAHRNPKKKKKKGQQEEPLIDEEVLDLTSEEK